MGVSSESYGRIQGRVEFMRSFHLQIYVVMEKMNGDMLEMILNSPDSRLSERVTKFMVYQVSVVTTTC